MGPMNSPMTPNAESPPSTPTTVPASGSEPPVASRAGDSEDEARNDRGLEALLEAATKADGDDAIRAIRAIRSMEVPEGQQHLVAETLGQQLLRLEGDSALSNRMRLELLWTLGAVGGRGATPVLEAIATRLDGEQSFLINRLAVEQLGRIADPGAVPTLIQALFLFEPGRPTMRMNDVAATALVRIGRPSLEPLLALLRGENQQANEIVRDYIEAVRSADAEVADAMTVEQVVGGEATFALGALGFPEAGDLLVEETRAADPYRRIAGAIALVRLDLPPTQAARVRSALQRVYGSVGARAKPQLLAAMRYTYDPELLPFLLARAGDAGAHRDVRVFAFEAAALLGGEPEAERLRRLTRREADGADGLRERFEVYSPALDAATECAEDLQCWERQLASDDALVARKAAYMIARYARGNAEMVRLLAGHLGHPDLAARMAILQALDHTATASVEREAMEAAIRRISELQEAEEGQPIWTTFGGEALPIQARLRHRLAM